MHKRCFRCNLVLPIGEFYTHPMMADGRLNKCKECTKGEVRSNRRARIEHYRSYDRQRFKTPTRKTQLASRQRTYRVANPEKTAARAAVNRAVRSGRLTKKPCEVCGCVDVDGHHDDYSKPLEVRWLCRVHHLIEHGKYLMAEDL